MHKGNTAELKRMVKSLDWYHTIDLRNGIVTKGHYDHRDYWNYYGIPEDLTGKTVLDIGAASGFFSFEMEKRGAKVTATDLPVWSSHDFGPNFENTKSDEEASSYLHTPFDLAKKILNSKVDKKLINIYDISPQTIGMYDMVFCGSVLLHLTDPIQALWRIQSVTKEVAIIATAVSLDRSPKSCAVFSGQHGGTAWWLPNQACLEAMVKVAGFKYWEWFSEFSLNYRDGTPGTEHAVIRAWNIDKKYGPPVTIKKSGEKSSVKRKFIRTLSHIKFNFKKFVAP